MNNYMNPLGNNNGNFSQQPPTMYSSLMGAPRHQVVRVNGEAGAKNFQMAPNCDALLLDNTAPIVWYAQTDGTGFLTVTPFDIAPHQTTPPVDLNELSNRVAKLEEYITNVQQSHTSTAKPRKQRQPEQQSVATTD